MTDDPTALGDLGAYLIERCAWGWISVEAVACELIDAAQSVSGRPELIFETILDRRRLLGVGVLVEAAEAERMRDRDRLRLRVRPLRTASRLRRTGHVLSALKVARVAPDQPPPDPGTSGRK